MIYGFLRETKELALKAGIDKKTGLPRTGLDEYLKIIFPKITDWVHDKSIGIINGQKCKFRPDYYSKQLKLIVEYDGINHYQNPDIILKDIKHTKMYESDGLTVIRIPYFIQLTRTVVKELFSVDIEFELFDENIPSFDVSNRCTPAYMCPLGIERAASEFIKFSSQYSTNIEYLKSINDERLTYALHFENIYNSIKQKENL